MRFAIFPHHCYNLVIDTSWRRGRGRSAGAEEGPGCWLGHFPVLQLLGWLPGHLERLVWQSDDWWLCLQKSRPDVRPRDAEGNSLLHYIHIYVCVCVHTHPPPPTHATVSVRPAHSHRTFSFLFRQGKKAVLSFTCGCPRSWFTAAGPFGEISSTLRPLHVRNLSISYYVDPQGRICASVCSLPEVWEADAGRENNPEVTVTWFRPLQSPWGKVIPRCRKPLVIHGRRNRGGGQGACPPPIIALGEGGPLQ